MLPARLLAAALRLAASSGVAVGVATDALSRFRRPRIFVYPLPGCSFEDFAPEEIDGPVWPYHPGRPPLLPIHHRIVSGPYLTLDPANATLFYIPAPFFLWDSSWTTSERSRACPVPFFLDSSLKVFYGAEADVSMRPLPKEWPLGGAKAWTISLVVRRTGRADGPSVVVTLGGVPTSSGTSVGTDKIPLAAYGVGFLDGCPAVFGCEHIHNAPCDTSLFDSSWHSMTVTYQDGVSRLFVNSSLWDERAVTFGVLGGTVHYGGLGPLGTSCGNDTNAARHAHMPIPFVGEARDLQIHSLAVPPELIWRCIEHLVVPLERTPDSHCFQLVRTHVESSPWLRPKGGWDHFVLFAGFDYPAAFRPIHQPVDSDFVLEHAWPAFSRFVILHFGARTERCAATFSDFGFTHAGWLYYPKCVHRVFRTVTIPPLLADEAFDCQAMVEAVAKGPRGARIAYRGLAYSAMIERSAIRSAATETSMSVMQETGQIRLEFTNWTHELLNAGVCRPDTAFEGLCAWHEVGGKVQQTSFGKERSQSMKRRSLELWGDSDTCLVLPGDGGYELRLYSMLNLGCVPVIVYAPGSSYPKLPFPYQLPWHEFAIFWAITTAASDGEMLFRSAHQVLMQLLHLDPDVLQKKREALMRYAPGLGWTNRGTRCGTNRHTRRTALDLLVRELQFRAEMPDQYHKITTQDWLWKIPRESMDISANDDLTGNGCPSGWMYCESHRWEPSRGDQCNAEFWEVGWRCPINCERAEGEVRCVAKRGGGVAPCRSPTCEKRIAFIEPQVGPRNLLRPLRLAIVTFSNRPQVSALTRPSLERYCDEHPGRYDLLVHDEPFLDRRDFAPAWNKLALVRRALVVGGYDAVVWVDDDVLITEPSHDPIYKVIVEKLLVLDHERLVAASLDERVDERVPMNTGVLIFKKSHHTLRLIDQLFVIGRRWQVLDGMFTLPRLMGWWDQDAIAVYVQRHGIGKFVVVEHRMLQSFVRVGSMRWRPGDFAAHFTGFRNAGSQKRLELIRHFVERRVARAESMLARSRVRARVRARQRLPWVRKQRPEPGLQA